MSAVTCNPGGRSRAQDYVLPVVVGALLVILIPYIHFGILYSNWYDKELVDREECTCNCWDTLFKGSYQKGVGGYKHIYFNLTSNTLKIWVFSVVSVIVLYETTRYLLRLYARCRLRPTMTFLLVCQLYPQYFTWWVYFNYVNDDFYSQWNHQTFFTITEWLSTAMIVYLCDLKRETSPRYLLVIISVAVLHMLAASIDQFIDNVILGNGQTNQIFRDIALMIPDLLNFFIPCLLWLQWCTKQGVSLRQSVSFRDMATAVGSVVILLVICRFL